MSRPGRNDPCPCGSGRKYKQCCMSREAAAPAAGSAAVMQALQAAMAAHRTGRLVQAEALYRQVLQVMPRQPDALHLLGLIAHQGGRHEAALELIGQAIAIKRREPGYYINLGLVHEALGRPDDAIASYRQALALNPDIAEANCNLGGLLAHHRDIDQAIALCRKALALRPDFVEALCNLGLAYSYKDQPDLAIDCCRRAIALRPDLAQAWHNLGIAHARLNCQDEAIDCFERALALNPGAAGVYNSLFFGLLYRAGTTPGELLAAHRRYAERIETPLRPAWPRHGNRRDPGRRLKIGYVSADFRYHSVAFFVEPLFAHHDRAAFEIHAYYDHFRNDEVTARLRSHVDHWIPCDNLSDAELAARIQADGIDILVDLSGHSAGNRLPVFARKPAPVQVTWLGYPATTGLTAIDWRLTADDVDPEGSDAYYSERLFRLPRTMWCYRPPAPAPEAPVRTTVAGAVCFGSMNNLPKISPETVACWSEILRALPAARLVMTGIPEGSARQLLLERFAGGGIGPERLEFHARLPVAAFQALASRIDIALDPFPYNGTTTTCESLWLGIPVVTLIGAMSVSRSGVALLRSIGLDALCAGSEADYVRIAVDLALDPARLQALRAGLHTRMATSPLRDEAGFARAIESAYGLMWRDWCDHPAGGAA